MDFKLRSYPEQKAAFDTLVVRLLAKHGSTKAIKDLLTKDGAFTAAEIAKLDIQKDFTVDMLNKCADGTKDKLIALRTNLTNSAQHRSMEVEFVEALGKELDRKLDDKLIEARYTGACLLIEGLIQSTYSTYSVFSPTNSLLFSGIPGVVGASKDNPITPTDRGALIGAALGFVAMLTHTDGDTNKAQLSKHPFSNIVGWNTSEFLTSAERIKSGVTASVFKSSAAKAAELEKARLQAEAEAAAKATPSKGWGLPSFFGSSTAPTTTPAAKTDEVVDLTVGVDEEEKTVSP
jgi:hypothetical protein